MWNLCANVIDETVRSTTELSKDIYFLIEPQSEVSCSRCQRSSAQTNHEVAPPSLSPFSHHLCRPRKVCSRAFRVVAWCLRRRCVSSTLRSAAAAACDRFLDPAPTLPLLLAQPPGPPRRLSRRPRPGLWRTRRKPAFPNGALVVCALGSMFFSGCSRRRPPITEPMLLRVSLQKGFSFAWFISRLERECLPDFVLGTFFSPRRRHAPHFLPFAHTALSVQLWFEEQEQELQGAKVCQGGRAASSIVWCVVLVSDMMIYYYYYFFVFFLLFVWTSFLS